MVVVEVGGGCPPPTFHHESFVQHLHRCFLLDTQWTTEKGSCWQDSLKQGSCGNFLCWAVGIFPTICNAPVTTICNHHFLCWSVGIFPTICKDKIHHHLSFIMTCNDCNLGQNPDLVPEKSINILPAAPLLSCSLSVKEERSEEEALFGLTKGWYQYVQKTIGILWHCRWG